MDYEVVPLQFLAMRHPVFLVGKFDYVKYFRCCRYDLSGRNVVTIEDYRFIFGIIFPNRKKSSILRG